MTQRISNQHWINDKGLIAQWQTFADELVNPEARDPGTVLQEAAQAQLSSNATGEFVDALLDRSNVEPLLGAYIRQMLHDAAPSKITTLEDLKADCERFVTQYITQAEEQADALEQWFHESFARQGIMRLVPQSFRRARTIANEDLKSVIRLVERLNAQRKLLEENIVDLRRVFHDPEGRIDRVHDRVHAIGNRLTPIFGHAHALKKEGISEDDVRTHLQAIKTAIRHFSTMNHTAPFTNPIETFQAIDPDVITNVEGPLPVFRDPTHPDLIVKAIEHLVHNARSAGATSVKIKAEYLPTDPVYTIAVEDDGPGIEPELLQGLRDGTMGSGWHILRTVILPKLGLKEEDWHIISPHQTDIGRGTLVMLFIPVVAQTGDEPGTGRRRKADSGPLSAMSSITPSPMPAIKRNESPASVAPAFEPSIAGGAACFSESPPGVLLRFPKL